jgi:hypothetical protein
VGLSEGVSLHSIRFVIIFLQTGFKMAAGLVHFKPGKAMRNRVNDARDQCGIAD